MMWFTEVGSSQYAHENLFQSLLDVKLTTQPQIVKQYQKVVKAYDNFEQNFPRESRRGLQLGLETC